MAEYWEPPSQYPPNHAGTSRSSPAGSDRPLEDSFISEFDRHRLTLVTHGIDEEWQLELWRYLQDVPADVTRDTDVIVWWSVSPYSHSFSSAASQ
jgi:hypothetical protein